MMGDDPLTEAARRAGLTFEEREKLPVFTAVINPLCTCGWNRTSVTVDEYQADGYELVTRNHMCALHGLYGYF